MAIKFKQNVNDIGVEIPSTEKIVYNGLEVHKVIWVEGGVSSQIWTKQKLVAPVFREEIISHYQKKIYVRNNNSIPVTLRYSNAESTTDYPLPSSSYTSITLYAGFEIPIFTLFSSTVSKYWYTGRAYFTSSGWNDSSIEIYQTEVDKRVYSLSQPVVNLYDIVNPDFRSEYYKDIYVTNNDIIGNSLIYSEASQFNSPPAEGSYVQHTSVIGAQETVKFKSISQHELYPKFYKFRFYFYNKEAYLDTSHSIGISTVLYPVNQKPLVYLHTATNGILDPSNKDMYVGAATNIFMSILLPLPSYQNYGSISVINANIGAVCEGPYISLTDNGAKQLDGLPGVFSTQGYHYLVKQYIITNTTPGNGATYSNTVRIGAGKDEIGWNYNIKLTTYKPASVPD